MKITCHIPILEYDNPMARVKTTHDVFSAIGEPKRRLLVEQLVLESLTVNQLVDKLAWSQPTVSKHLNVLKQVGLVSERRQGRYRIYQVEVEELRPIQEWMHQFEKFWGGHLEQLDDYLNSFLVGTDSPSEDQGLQQNFPKTKRSDNNDQ